MRRRLALVLGAATALAMAGAVADHGTASAKGHGGGTSQACSQKGGGGKNSPHTVTCVGVIQVGGILSNDTITINNSPVLSNNQLTILSNDVVSHIYVTVSDVQAEVLNVYRSEFNILSVTENDIVVLL